MGAAAIPVAMLAITAVGTAVATYSSVSAAQAQQSQYRYQSKVAEQNAAILDQQARDSILRGQQAADANDRKVSAMQARARAGLAGTGFDVNSGSALDTQVDIGQLGALDSATIRQNASREAWAIKTQQTNQLAGAAQASAAAGSFNPALSGAAPLLEGGARFGDQWYKYKADGAFG